MFQTKVIEKIKTHILCPITFSTIVPSDFLLVLFMQVSDQFVQPARSDADSCPAGQLHWQTQTHKCTTDSHILCLHTSPCCMVTTILKTCLWQLFFFNLILFLRAGCLAGQLLPLRYACEISATWCGSSALLSLNWLPTLISCANYWRAATAELL
jgi:hypothetical protein